MSDLTLFVDANYESPWAVAAFVALEEKQLPYTLVTKVLSKKETFEPGFAARTNRIPALKHGDFWLAESTAITEYLAEVFPFPKHPRLFPEDLQKRAICREVMHWLRTDLMPLRAERPTTTFWCERAKKPLSAEAQAAAKRLVDYATALLQHGRPTLFDAWCIADVDLAIALQRLVINGDPVPEVVAKYVKANWERPAMVKWNAFKRNATPL